MNATHEYVERQKVVCRDEWFKNHIATLIANPEHRLHEPNGALIINWQNPESWNYGCRFIIHRRWLCVVGDIGEAVYEWGQDVTLEFLAGLDFSYFHSKCRASASGTKFEQWNPREAWQSLKQTEKEYKSICKFTKELTTGSGKDEYEYAARQLYDRTGDCDLASMISSGGMVPSVHGIGMFVGLQMAIKQLSERHA